jgi:D-tyrosyl-tRNA(Tyr) deacylase
LGDWVIGLLQRVSEARVSIAGRTVGEIGPGLLVLVGVERGDDEATAERLLERLLGYRVFADAAGRMNRSLRDIGGGLLLVSQFTLVADTDKGTRPSFSAAAGPEEGRRLFEYLLQRARTIHAPVATGEFGAHMQVALVNDGPVTFQLRVRPKGACATDAPAQPSRKG